MLNEDWEKTNKIVRNFKIKLLNSNDPIKALNEINDAEIKLPNNINDIESYALKSMIREIIDVA